MDMKQIYAKLQEYFAKGQTGEAEDFLIEMLKEAQQLSDYNSLIMLLNEMIGLCRESGQKEKSLGYSGQVLQLMQQLGMQDSEAYATTLLNVATACRAAGKHVEAYQFYMEVFPLYEKWLEPGDYHYASLYNNMSLLFQETEEYERAVECQGKALSVLSALPGKEFETAVSHANMASTLCKISELEGAPEIAAQAADEAECAIETFEKLGVEDVHLAAALAAYADAMTILSEFGQAQSYYEAAMGLIESLVGKTEAYTRVAEKLAYVKQTHIPGLALCRNYYEEIGKPMLMQKFPDYYERMAIGLCGEGSECLGFDDAQSSDHDFGPGFAIWISEEDEAVIGEELQRAYDALPKEYKGYQRKETAQGSGRTGVCTYGCYLERILGLSHVPETEAEWLYVDEYALRAAVSGEVFHDPKGEFSTVLEKLRSHYPDGVRTKRLWQEYTLFEQCGPYNYPRMMRRRDMAAANLLLAEAMQHAAKCLYLTEKVYAPHTKWLVRGLSELKGCKREAALIRSILENLSTAQETVDDNMERLAELSVMLGEKMKPQLVDEIVKMEWEAFDQVKNEGGRAGCQDDWTTFEIMRKSQYLTWNAEMLLQYREDFGAAVAKGWNPITEKYARMMESTAPEKFGELCASLPVISEEKKEIMEGIIAIQVTWMEAFAQKYPKVAGNARSIHTSEDTAYNTSYETYLRGEMGTYSDKMLLLYGAFIAGLAKEDKNLAYLTMENTVHMYGYADIETAEEKMW
ncbi:MAG: DUF4125 family protein [Lachnospiraceae bacterium]|nr:DUF4125 family protein [Lachnospiraceae bacterium]